MITPGVCNGKMSGYFLGRKIFCRQSLDMFGLIRGEDGKMTFPRHSDKRFPIGRIRKRLAAYGWRGERLNQEVARIVAGPDIFPERSDYSIIFPYGWERNQLTLRCGECFPGRVVVACWLRWMSSTLSWLRGVPDVFTRK